MKGAKGVQVRSRMQDQGQERLFLFHALGVGEVGETEAVRGYPEGGGLVSHFQWVCTTSHPFRLENLCTI